ncbi:MAG: hypothetical protein QF898_19380 [SAR202 cluster bacterium]|jgi:uncharacterized membrane protein|nr:hypothetical protein [SAR202 cluster bacterium]MDP6714143.1 hypothetical protein [SAR202 cluster bacterium]
MEGYAFARVVHILGVVLWIGGVAMVTTVLIPAIKRLKSEEEQVSTFEMIEGRFALQARVTTLLTGLSGFYMLYYTDGWSRYTDVSFWWLHAMTIGWVMFMLILFVLEPLVLHRLFMERAKKDPVRTLAFVHRFHVVALALSLVTIAGSVAGSHGWLWV